MFAVPQGICCLCLLMLELLLHLLLLLLPLLPLLPLWHSCSIHAAAVAVAALVAATWAVSM